MSALDLRARVTAQREAIATVCRRRHVRRLELFGSLARGEGHPGSDVDLLVDFEPLPPGAYAEAYFGLREDLEQLFDAPVDLVVERAIRNPFFRQAIEGQREALYAA
ncbi:MAG: nucleotidyltransferase family protein [Pseudomonadota bacterium]